MNEVEARRLLVVENASPAELKEAYRRMVKRWHPDHFSSDSDSYAEAIRRTQHINEAYQLLAGKTAGIGVGRGVAGEPAAAAWKGSSLRRRIIRERLIVVAVSVAVFLCVSWIVHDVILGF